MTDYAERVDRTLGDFRRARRALSTPDLWLQRLTTFEPDLTQLEVAIAAMTPCIPENGEDIY